VLPTLVFAIGLGLALGRFAFAGTGGSIAATRPAAAAAADSSAQATVATLQGQLRATPDDPTLLTKLGVSYLTRARETADPSYYTKAADALDRSQSLAPDASLTLTGEGLLALSRHDFAGALAWGTKAHALDPAAPEPLGVVVDAHVELGQYADAATAAQEMLDRRPSLASLSRASYLREIDGDVPGAITVMTQAAIAGAGSASDIAYVDTLLGDLRLGAGALPEAEAAYGQALQQVDAYPAADVGLAKVAAARGDLANAAQRLEDVTARLPLPATVALLGDVYDALGRPADAAAQYALVRSIEDLNRANGVAVDFELAHFEADHARDPGADAATVVDLAQTAVAQRPTVFAEDTLGWALRQAGRPAEALPHARAAVRLGTADALLWYHLAATEADLGQLDAARTDLTRALAVNPAVSVRDLRPARDLAGRLGLAA
jgi:tetratricopeptide (TPR) repeat protein